MCLVYYYAEFNRIFYDHLPSDWNSLDSEEKDYILSAAFEEFVSMSEDRDEQFINYLEDFDE